MTDATSPHRVIFASKVNGTPVFNPERERIGHIEDVAIGKREGRVAYAVLSFGGFLGIGEKFHPLPWSMLEYDTEKNGYIVSLSKDELSQAPAYSKDELVDLGDTDERYREQIHTYYAVYGATPYWI
jgi:hypothetical protein